MNNEFQIELLEDEIIEDESTVCIDVKHKLRDDFTEDNIYYPLISDISDDEGVLAEHSLLNTDDNWLQFALFKDKGDYYFFDIRKNAIELRDYAEDSKFICPCCKGALTAVSAHTRCVNGEVIKVPTHLRHLKNDDSDYLNCMFNKGNKNHQELKDKLYSGESFKHKKLKLRIFNLAKKGKMELSIPYDYSVVVDKANFEASVDFDYEIIKVVDAVLEKRVLKKDDITNGYQPDITFITDTGEEIYVEITVASGKSVSKYSTIWNRLKRPVIELKYSENKDVTRTFNFLDACEAIDLTDPDAEVMIYSNVSIRFLYSPIVAVAREQYHVARLKQANLRRVYLEEQRKKAEIKIKKKETRTFLWKGILKFTEIYREQKNYLIYYNYSERSWYLDGYPISDELLIKGFLSYKNEWFMFTLPKQVWQILAINGKTISFPKKKNKY